MKKYDGIQTEKQENFTFPQYYVDRNGRTEEADTRNNQQYVQLKASHNTEKRTLSAQIGLVHDDTPEERNKDLLAYTGKYSGEQTSMNYKT